VDIPTTVSLVKKGDFPSRIKRDARVQRNTLVQKKKGGGGKSKLPLPRPFYVGRKCRVGNLAWEKKRRKKRGNCWDMFDSPYPLTRNGGPKRFENFFKGVICKTCLGGARKHGYFLYDDPKEMRAGNWHQEKKKQEGFDVEVVKRSEKLSN